MDATELLDDWRITLGGESTPPPTLEEMIQLLDRIAAQKFSSVLAVASTIDGTLNRTEVRNVAILDACMRMLIRISNNVERWPTYAQEDVKGKRAINGR